MQSVQAHRVNDEPVSSIPDVLFFGDEHKIEVPPGAVDLVPPGMRPRILLLQSNDVILKAGFMIEMSEAAAMQFVAENTSIPVPRVIDAYIKDGNGYIFMTRAPGVPLGDVWKDLNSERRLSIITQLADYVEQMGRLQGNFYGSLWNSPCRDIFFKHLPFKHHKPQYGPYQTRQEYNAGLVEALENSRPNGVLDRPPDLELASLLQEDCEDVKIFSHGDLHPLNIIVDDHDRITGLIDWGSAGFSIRGRDYTEAKLRARNELWMEALEQIFPPHSRTKSTMFADLDRALTLYTGI